MAVNPLNTSFTFSFMRRGGSKPKTEDDSAAAASGETKTTEPVNPYENAIKTIIQVSTVEEFWEAYNFLKRPSDLPTTTDYHFFRGGIKPTWEDSNNMKGGKWIVRLPKGLSSRYWEEVMLALIGGQFLGVPDGEICGAVLSIRYNEDILAVWNKTASDRDLVDRLRDAMKKVLQLPTQFIGLMEYKPHQNSMQDRSSFRNTQVWKPKERSQSETTPASSSRRPGAWAEERRSKGRDSGRSWR